jgi:hypothetical protein
LIDAEAAAELDAMEREIRNEERRWNRHHVNVTDLGFEPLAPPVRRSRAPHRLPGGNAWEGPRYRFRRLLGASEIWTGPPVPGQFCHGRRLSRGEYCLDCERSGRDQQIPSAGDLPAVRQYNGRLRGGRG